MQRKFQVGCPCCDSCPDCTAPTPVSTGSTSANTAWYLTPDDPTDSAHVNQSSYYAIRASTPLNHVDQTALFPATHWCKLRIYFAYEDIDNCAFAEIWGTLTGPLASRVYTYYTRVVAVCDGTETELGSDSSDSDYYTTYPVSMFLSVTYDAATGIVRAVGGVQRYSASAWYSYDYDTLPTCEDESQVSQYGMRYGYGVGYKTASAGLEIAATYNAAYIDYCQSFPHVFTNGTDSFYHPWLRSTSLTLEEIEIAQTGVPSCTACPATETLYRPTTRYFSGNETTADMLTDEVLTDWTGTLPPGLGGNNIEWHFSYELDVGWPFSRMNIVLKLIGRYKITSGYGTGTYSTRYTLAYQAILFGGSCDPAEYDGADAVDGLVFDTWTLYDFGTWLTHGVPDLSGVEVTLSLP